MREKTIKTISFIVLPVGASALGAKGAEGSAEMDSIRDIVDKIAEDLIELEEGYRFKGEYRWFHKIKVIPVISSSASYKAWNQIRCLISGEIRRKIDEFLVERTDNDKELLKRISVEVPSGDKDEVLACGKDIVFSLSVASSNKSVEFEIAYEIWKAWLDAEWERDLKEVVEFGKDVVVKDMALFESKGNKSENLNDSNLISLLAAYGYGRMLEKLIHLFDDITEPLYITGRCRDGEPKDKYVTAGVYVVSTSGQKFVSILTSLVASMYADVTFYYRYERAEKGFFLSIPPVQINTALMDEFRLVLDLIMEEVRTGKVLFAASHKLRALIDSLPPIFKDLFFSLPEKKTDEKTEKKIYVYLPALKAIMDIYDRWRLRYIKHGYGWGMFRELQKLAAMLEVMGEGEWPWCDMALGLKEHFDRWALVWVGDIIPQTVEHRHLHSKRNMEQGMAFLAGIRNVLYKDMSPSQLFWFYYLFILAAFTHDLGHNFPGTEHYPHYYLEPNTVRNLHGYVSAWMLWEAWKKVKESKGKPKIKDNVEEWAMLSYTFPFSSGADGTGSKEFKERKQGKELEEFYNRFEWVIKSAMLIAIYHRQFAPVFSGDEGKPHKQRIHLFKKLLGEDKFCEFARALPVFARCTNEGRCSVGCEIKLIPLEDVLKKDPTVYSMVDVFVGDRGEFVTAWRKFRHSLIQNIDSINNFLFLHTFFRLMDAFDVTWERAGSRDYIGIRMWISSLQKHAVSHLMDHVALSSLPENMEWLYKVLRDQKEFLEGNYPHYVKHGWIKGIYPWWEKKKDEKEDKLILHLDFIFRAPMKASVVYKEKWQFFREELKERREDLIREDIPEEVFTEAIEVKEELKREFELVAKAWNDRLKIIPKMRKEVEFKFAQETTGERGK